MNRPKESPRSEDVPVDSGAHFPDEYPSGAGEESRESSGTGKITYTRKS